jgi:hypothetical protein
LHASRRHSENKVRMRGLVVLESGSAAKPPHTQPCPGPGERQGWRGGKGHDVHTGMTYNIGARQECDISASHLYKWATPSLLLAVLLRPTVCATMDTLDQTEARAQRAGQTHTKTFSAQQCARTVTCSRNLLSGAPRPQAAFAKLVTLASNQNNCQTCVSNTYSDTPGSLTVCGGHV